MKCFERCGGDPKGCEKCTENEKICQKLGEYEETGLMPEDVKDLVEIRTPKKPIRSETQDVRYTMVYICPSCERKFTGTGIAKFCYHCGQALDWEEAWERPWDGESEIRYLKKRT